MKIKIFFILLLVTFLFYTPTLFAEYHSLCCDSLYTTTEQTDSCCLEVTLHNPECNSPIIEFYQWDSSTGEFNLVYSVTSNAPSSVTYTFCPMNRDGFIKYRIRVAQSGQPNQPECNLGDDAFVEGWTQFTDSIDVSSCCNCPSNVSDWLTLNVEKDETSCPDGCKVTPVLNIPDTITCYKYYALATSPNFNLGPIKPISQISTEWECVGYGETIEYDVALLQSNDVDVENEWNNLCTIEKVSDMCISDDPQPCKPDCENSDWLMPPKTLNVDLGNGCIIFINYTYRRACPPINWQDIQILKIYSSNCSNWSFKDIYQKAIYNVIKTNTMGFNPLRGDTLCYSIWRVIGAACQKYTTYQDTTGLIHYELDNCGDSLCCLQRMKVCRLSNGEVTIETIGDVYATQQDSNCYVVPDSSLIIPPLLPEGTCFATCDWIHFNELNTLSGKISLNERNSNNSVTCKLLQKGDKLAFVVSCTENDNCNVKINVFDVYGNLVVEKEDKLSSKTKVFNINSIIKHEGIYLYNIYIDDKLIKRGKFIIK